MNREYKTKRIIKKHLRTVKTHEKSTRDKISQVESS